MSLGMVNLILRRLAKTGYIKIRNLNKRKMGYILTARGLAEKMARSYSYLVRAIRTYAQYRSSIESLLDRQIALGHRQFALLGHGDIADLTELLLKEKGSAVLYRRWHEGTSPNPENGELLLDCRLDNTDPPVGISVLESLLAHNTPMPEPQVHPVRKAAS